MVTGLILLIFMLIIFSIIGLFHRKTGKLMRVVFFYLRRLRANRRNIKKFPSIIRKFFPVLRRRRGRGLFLKKIFENYRKNKFQKNQKTNNAADTDMQKTN